MSDAFTGVHRRTIMSSAARNRVPYIQDGLNVTREGGLITYGPRYVDQFRRAAAYVDRILRGTKPADLPVELPAEFELGINLQSAKALGLTIPPTLLAIADEVIE